MGIGADNINKPKGYGIKTISVNGVTFKATPKNINQEAF
jgi:hypothetical protein